MPINQNLFEEELDEFFNNLINSYLNYLSQEDETYEYESDVLYRQGFIDCFDFLKLLDY